MGKIILLLRVSEFYFYFLCLINLENGKILKVYNI